MALITITGFPCSGKTHVAHSIEKHFKTLLSSPTYTGPSYKVSIVSDSSVPYTSVVSSSSSSTNAEPGPSSPPTWRNSYDTSLEEKPSRASLFSSLTRELGTDRIVICDAANYIKGFRYQMYCAGREARCRVATVFAAASPEQCASRHSARNPEDRYRQETFDNMIQRYEEPSSMVRWDSPLFTFTSTSDLPGSGSSVGSDADVSSGPIDSTDLNAGSAKVDGAESSSSAMGEATQRAKEDLEWKTLLDELWVAVTTGDLKGPTAAVSEAPKPPANSLQILTRGTSHLISLLTTTLSYQSSPPPTLTLPATSPFTSPISIRLPPGRPPPTLSELQRLKRQFETIQKKALGTNAVKGEGIAGGGGWTEQGVGEGFVGFLQASWGT